MCAQACRVAGSMWGPSGELRSQLPIRSHELHVRRWSGEKVCVVLTVSVLIVTGCTFSMNCSVQ